MTQLVEPAIRIEQTEPKVATVSPKPIVVLCPFHFGVRNFVHSGLTSNLEHAGFQPHVLERAPAQESAANSDVTKLFAPPLKQTRHILSAVDVLQHASFYRRHHLTSGRIMAWWYRPSESVWKRMQHAVIDTLAIAGGLSPFYQWQMALIEPLQRRIWALAPVVKQLQRLRPALVVATSCVSRLEEPFLLAARDLGIPTLGFVQSFDNLTSCSWVGDCDSYAVWNQRLKDQLLNYHRVRNPDQVYITGTPQFDFHTQEQFRWSREYTLQQLGIEPGERYLLYAANAHDVTPTEPELIQELARRCAQTPELQAHRIVVRVHPNDNFQRWADLMSGDPRVIVSLPTKRSKHFSSPNEQARLVNTLLHADVCYNMWSSMSLDAAVLDTPVVCIGFANRPGSREDRFCKLVYETDFYRPIVESGGVRLAYSMEQLLVETLAYVRDRSRDHAKRLQLARTECGPLDGHSTERLTQLIIRSAA